MLPSLHTGLRNHELKLLRWRQIDFIGRRLIVGKPRTVSGGGREIPLSMTPLECLREWHSNFPNANPEHFVFPSERYGLDGESGYADGGARPYLIRPGVAMGSWKVAWTAARDKAGVHCRWHDLRHTFVSKMAEARRQTQPLWPRRASEPQDDGTIFACAERGKAHRDFRARFSSCLSNSAPRYSKATNRRRCAL